MLVRRISTADRNQVSSHLGRLAPHDRVMRFCGSISDEAIRRYCADVERFRVETIGCFVDGHLRAAAELILAPAPDRGSVEIALSVETPFQGRGLGRTILARALLHARNRLIGAVSFVTLAANTRMRRLAHRQGATLAVSDGMLEGRFLLPWPSQLSIAQEIASEGLELLDRVIPCSRPSAAMPKPSVIRHPVSRDSAAAGVTLPRRARS